MEATRSKAGRNSKAVCDTVDISGWRTEFGKACATKDNGLTIREIAAELGISLPRTRDWVRQQVAKGAVVETGRFTPSYALGGNGTATHFRIKAIV